MTSMAEPPSAYHPPNHFILQIDHVSEATRTPRFDASKELPSGSSTPGDGWRSTNVQTPNGSQINLVPQPPDKERPPLDEKPEISNFMNAGRSTFSVSTVVPEQVHHEPPYNVFSPRKRKALMYLCAVAGMFSSLSANIYFPAVGQISRVSILILHVLPTVLGLFHTRFSNKNSQRPSSEQTTCTAILHRLTLTSNSTLVYSNSVLRLRYI
jgi:hypothetical protein